MANELTWGSTNPEIRKRVEPFFTALAGKHVTYRSAYLIGPSARGEFNPKQPEIHVLLVFDAIKAELLETLASLGLKFGKAGIRAPLIMTVEHIKDAQDVFPLELFELKTSNIRLFGEPLLEGVSVDRKLLRLETERELRRLSINMQYAYVRAAGDKKWMAQWFTDNIEIVLPLLRALIFLIGNDANVGNSQALRITRESTGFDISAVHSVYELAKKNKSPRPDEVRQVFDKWQEVLTTLILKVDAFDA